MSAAETATRLGEIRERAAALPLLTLMLSAPLCALEVQGDGSIHAVTMEALTRVDGPLVSACGRAVKLLAVPLGSDDPVPWPPAVRGLPTTMSRCRACHVATGRKRPACRFAVKVRP